MRTVERSNGSGRDAELVAAACAGDKDAFERLYDTYVDHVFAVVMDVVHDRAAAADLTQDTFETAWRQLSRLRRPASFRSWLLRIARNAALNHVKVVGRTETIDNTALTRLEEDASAGGSHILVGVDVADRACRYDDPAQVSEDAEVCELVWTAAEVLGPNDASLLDLHLRHNMSPAEIAPIVGASRQAMKQALFRLRAKLATSVQAAVLWHGGRPRCHALRSALDTASVIGFGREAVGVIDRHIEGCPACEERQRTLLSPTVLFEAIPIAAAPLELRDRIAAAIAGPRPVSSVAGANANAASVHTGRIGRGLLPELMTHPLGETVAKMATDAVAATVAVLVATALIAGGVGRLGPGAAIAAATESEPIERNLAPPPADPQEAPIPGEEPSDGPDTPTPSDETPRPSEVAQDNADETQATNPGQEEEAGDGTVPDDGATPGGPGEPVGTGLATNPGQEEEAGDGAAPDDGATPGGPGEPVGTGLEEEAGDLPHGQGENGREEDEDGDGDEQEEDPGQGHRQVVGAGAVPGGITV